MESRCVIVVFSISIRSDGKADAYSNKYLEPLRPTTSTFIPCECQSIKGKIDGITRNFKIDEAPPANNQ
jgi:hypothetical protein